MNRKRTSAAKAMLADMPFSKLLETDPELAELRREYACQPSDERRNAADWQYDSACASDILDQSLGQHGVLGDVLDARRGYVAALAIDPDHAPAMLTVGAIEYQLGRVDEAMAVLIGLPRLAHDDSLPEIIDKAGEEPDNYRHLSDLGFSLTQAGQYDEAERILLRATELAPPDYEMAQGNLDHLNDMRD